MKNTVLLIAFLFLFSGCESASAPNVSEGEQSVLSSEKADRFFSSSSEVSDCASPEKAISESEAEVSGEVLPFSRAKLQDGTEINASFFADYKLTLVNVWATYCQPCIHEIPALQSVYETYKDRGVQVLGICIDAEETNESAQQRANDLLQQANATYPTAWNNDELQSAWLHTVSGVPISVLINSNGEIIGSPILGMHKEAYFSAAIDNALEHIK